MTDTLDPPLWITLVLAGGFLFHWIAVGFEWNRIKPYTKALAMILVIAWTLYSVSFKIDLLVVLLLTAQVFGLLGDILLLFPAKCFVWGLGAFLIGHFFYLGLMISLALTCSGAGGLKDGGWGVVIIGMVLWISYLVFFWRLLAPYLLKQKSDRPFWGAVVFYGSVLSFIVLFSTWCVFVMPGSSWVRFCLPVGAVLFFVSDNLLAYDRFVRKIRHARLWVIMTYHLGQFNLTVGLLYLIGQMA